MILQMIEFFAVLFGVAGFTIYDVSRGMNEPDEVQGDERTRGRE